jgi:hypothetical protein
VTPFPVIELGPDVRREREEQLGSKRKFWFRHADDELWLFKYARPNTGEHWAEKLAAEIAGALQLPHAQVELARFEGTWGAMTRDFTFEGRSGLVHGNELLTELDPAYPATKTYRVRAHTLSAVQAVLGQDFIAAPAAPGVPAGFTPFDVFVGYLLLDALIGNTDRHHENWGILLQSSLPRSAELAPTYDHASSLGRELTDAVRQRKYRARIGQYVVEKYLERARSALFATPESPRPMGPLESFRAAAERAKRAGQHWLGQLRTHQAAVHAAVHAVPEAAMSGEARAFSAQLLGSAVRKLLD